MKEEKKMLINDSKLSEVNFETITDEELEQIAGGEQNGAKWKKKCQTQLGIDNILCKTM